MGSDLPVLKTKLLRTTLPLTLLLLAGAAALAYQAWHLGMTADEPSHLAAAYAWWEGSDILNPSDTPPVMRIISGWVPRAMGIPLPRDTEAWRKREAYDVGAGLVGSLSPERAQRFLFFMRLPFIAFPLLIAWLLWRWGRELFGETIGLTMAACGLLEPTILGHGALIKSDVPAAFGALWFAYAAWQYWKRPRLGTLLVMTAAMTVATLIKFTLLPLVGVALVLALWRGPRLAGALIVPLAFYVGTLAAYQFRAAPLSPEITGSMRAAGVPRLLVPAARQAAKLPWPEQWARGLRFIGMSLHGDGFTGYMLGHRIEGRVAAYYPLAWAVKFPVPLQILTLAGLAAFLVRLRRRKAGAADALIWGSAAFYFGSGVFSSFHIGFRHVLPALPFFILGGGFALARWGGMRAVRIGGAALLAWFVLGSIRICPNGISYFNEWIGGPENGWRYLADSNVDWGQNLPDLAAFMERQNIGQVKSFFFGLDSPGRYLKPGGWDPQPWPFSADSPLPVRLAPSPGYYAVSVNAMVGVGAAPGREDYLACFRGMRPVGRAGYSIFIYRIGPAERAETTEHRYIFGLAGRKKPCT